MDRLLAVFTSVALFAVSLACTPESYQKTSEDKVYYFRQGELMSLNGQPDPLNGTFDEDKVKLELIESICSDGRALYSLEWYYDYNIHGYIFYLCKDRKPLYELNKTDWDDQIMCMAARNGRVAFVIQRNNREYNYVVVVNPDGTSQNDVIPGEYHNMNEINCALSSSGDLYLAAQYQDSSNGQNLGLYKYSANGEWTFSKISKGSSYEGHIDISESGDIYVLTIEHNDGYDAVLYKNITERSVCYHSKDYFQYAFSVAGGHVYTAVIEWGEASKITEQCDGDVIRTIETDVKQQFLSSCTNSLKLTSSGDCYLATFNQIFKNGDLLYSIPGVVLENFCVVE